jgi:hypothetical protein
VMFRRPGGLRVHGFPIIHESRPRNPFPLAALDVLNARFLRTI